MALDEPHDALQLAGIDLEPFHEGALGLGDQLLARLLEPAKRGRAMHPVKGAQLVDGQLIEDVLSQQIALTCGERLTGSPERLLELDPVALAEVGQLRALLRRGQRKEKIVVDRYL